MTDEEHRQRHQELHRALDELAADWMAHQPRGKLFSNSTILELVRWSFEQTREPSPAPGWPRIHDPTWYTED